MELPKGFEGPGYVCWPRRPVDLVPMFTAFLAAHGFTMAQADNCVFYKSNSVVCVCVDNFLVAPANDDEIQHVQSALETEFRLDDLGTPRLLLRILSDFSMETRQLKTTPMNPKFLLNYSPEENDSDDAAEARSGTAISSLIYLMIGTRTDVAFALGTWSRFTSRPQSHHQAAPLRLLRYIKATQALRITYRNGQLIGYTDAGFGGSVGTDGACSTSGYVFQLAGAPVSWSSKRQGEVATSTTHAEYIGQYNAILHLQ